MWAERRSSGAQELAMRTLARQIGLGLAARGDLDDVVEWSRRARASAPPGLPPIQPMFPPAHRIPIAIAAYRKEFVALAGRKADAYLARPAESIPSLTGILERLRSSAVEAGRDPGSIESAGYLLSLV